MVTCIFNQVKRKINMILQFYLSESAVEPCLCDLASGLVRELQGTEAKVSGPDVQKNNSAQGSPDGSCPSDVNKKVMLTVCFSCLLVPILVET
jgi:hypothetical protein